MWCQQFRASHLGIKLDNYWEFFCSAPEDTILVRPFSSWSFLPTYSEQLRIVSWPSSLLGHRPHSGRDCTFCPLLCPGPQCLARIFLDWLWTEQYFWFYVSERRSREEGGDKGEMDPLKNRWLYQVSHIEREAEQPSGLTALFLEEACLELGAEPWDRLR